MARKAIAVAAILAISLVAAVWLLLPGLAERAILRKLGALGLDDVALQVDAISLHGIRLTDVRIGRTLAIDRIDAGFDAWPIAKARATEIVVSGARWSTRTTTTGIDLAPFDRLKTSTAARPGELPFDRLRLEDAVVSIDRMGRVPFNATIEAEPGRTIHARLAASPEVDAVLGNRRVRIAGASVSGEAAGQLDRRELSLLSLDAFVQEATVDRNALEEIGVSAELAGHSIEWKARAWAPDLDLMGSASGWLPASAEEWSARPPVDLLFDLSASPLALEAELEGMARVDLALLRADVPAASMTASGDLATAALTVDRIAASAELSAVIDQGGASVALDGAKAAVARGGLRGMQARITGVRATVPPQKELLSIRFGEPPEFHVWQRIEWKVLQVGDRSFGRGFAKVRLDSPNTVRVERAESRLPEGGALAVDTFRFAIGSKRVGFDLLIDDVPLEHWLALIGRNKVSGEGRVSGRVPVQLVLSKPLRVALGRGELMGKPGAKLRVNDLATARELIDRASLGGDDVAETVKARLLEALQELELWRFELEFVPDEHDTDLTVHLAGRGTRGARQEIGGLTINFHNFGSGLNQALRFGSEAAELKARAKEEMENDPILDLFQ